MRKVHDEDEFGTAIYGPNEFDVTEDLYRRRTLYLPYDVDEGTISDLVGRMLILSRSDGDINLIIQSWGGSLADCLGLYDIIKSIPNDVCTFGLGKCTSAGAFLLAAGTKGKRYIYPSTRVMIHQPSVFVGYGKVTDQQIALKNDQEWKELFLTRWARMTGQPEKKALRDAERDKWFSAEEAVAYGIVDHLVVLRE
jgi:ATP-dependent Clp protease protease subunit